MVCANGILGGGNDLFGNVERRGAWRRRLAVYQVRLVANPDKKWSTWAFWEKIRRVKAGDTVIHLRGVPPHAHFAGYPTAIGDGAETRSRPPEAGKWSWAKSFYRADLGDFTAFEQPVNLTEIFVSRREELENYLAINKGRPRFERLNLFYVRQSRRLQCQNGAYLSDVDDRLLIALFGSLGEIPSSGSGKQIVSVRTSTQIATVRARQGQTEFSDGIRRLYGHLLLPGMRHVRF